MTAVRWVVHLCEETFGENRGNFQHRVEHPARLVAKIPGWRVSVLPRSHPDALSAAKTCSLLLVHGIAAPEVTALLRLRRAHGRPSLFEISDDLAPGAWLHSHHAMRSTLLRQDVLLNASLCDGLIVSSQALAQKYSCLAPRTEVLDNYVPPPLAPPDKPSGFVFGWAGTRSHRTDLAAIAAVVTEFCGDHGDAVFALMGDPDLFDLFAALPAGQRRFVPFGSYRDYSVFLGGLHVGLAPLLHSDFNAGRTDVKFSEYAVHGAAALLSAHPVYARHSERALLFDDPAGLRAGLERLYRDPALRQALVEQSRTWVEAHYGAKAICDRRLACYESFHPPAVAEPPPTDENAEALSAMLDAAKTDLCNGRPQACLTGCRAVMAKRPDVLPAHWLAFKALLAMNVPQDATLAAASLLADPVYRDLVCLHLSVMWRQAQPERAAAYGAAIRDPLLRLRLQGMPGSQAGAADKLAYFCDVLALHPYDYFALAACLRLTHETADASQTETLTARLALLSNGRNMAESGL